MRAWISVCLCLLAAACVSTNVRQLDHALRPARAPDSVSVLAEAPQQPYTVIAVIESRGESVFDSFEDLRMALRTEAAALGGDAVILGQEHTDERFILTGTAMIKSERKKLTGTVVVFDG
jgi:hypothetical protein